MLILHYTSADLKHWQFQEVARDKPAAYDSTGTVVATGGADRIVHVYDIRRGYCTHALRGHGSPVHLAVFHPVPSRLQLFSAAEDRTIRAWDLAHKQAQTDATHQSSTSARLCRSVARAA